MRVIYFDPSAPIGEAKALGASPRASIDEVLQEAEMVSIHVPATDSNRHLIDEHRLALMQRHAFLVNTSRGDLVDTVALVRALKSGTIAGAGLDVFENEPVAPAALLALPNVVVLPHLGSATMESRVRLPKLPSANPLCRPSQTRRRCL